MFKKITLVVLSFSLSGCISSSTSTIPSETHAFFTGDALCLLTPGRTEKQKLKSLHIEQWGEPPGFTQQFNNAEDYKVIKKDTCMPLFGYKFETGYAYHITLGFTEDTGRAASDYNPDYYSASFIVWESSDKSKNISFQ